MTGLRSKINWQWVFTAATFAFCVYMMLNNLMHSALWGDEWIEYYYSQEPIGKLYEKIISTYQPPLYNYMLHFWLKISQSTLWFRLLNVIFGTLTVIFIWKTIRRYYEVWIANIAVIILAVSYQWIFCVQECSEYASMVFFVTVALYYFVRLGEEYSFKQTCVFVAMCVLAMYSQYGAFFLVFPLCLFLYIKVIKSKNRKEILFITGLYFAVALIFAWPLYHFFAKIQISNNEISSHVVAMTWENVKEFPVIIGRLVRYFWNISESRMMIAFTNLFSIAVLIGSIILLINKKTEKLKKVLIGIFLFIIVVHYVLVVKQIYAMLHPGESSGFDSRYSYFYFPIFVVATTIIVVELVKSIGNKRIQRAVAVACILGSIIVVVKSYPDVNGNWNKAYDDQFSEIWMEEKGYQDTTYLFGRVPEFGFNYWVPREEGYLPEYSGNVVRYEPEFLGELPDVIWCWKTNWSYYDFEEACKAIEDRGYKAQIRIIKAERPYDGRLIKYVKEGATQ